jgi:hypothetical protein
MARALLSIGEAKSKILDDIQNCLSLVRTISSHSITKVEEGVLLLQQLREETYEDLNQIQHELLIVSAADWLINRGVYPEHMSWEWNPRQTGDNTEPDLRGHVGRNILLSAEATTSARPVGTIDKRMRCTLEKLAMMPGEKYYFVRTTEMAQRARAKISKGRWPIDVVELNLATNLLDLGRNDKFANAAQHSFNLVEASLDESLG